MSTAAPMTNDTTIRIVLVLLLTDWMARIYNIKGTFLKGNVRMMKRYSWKFLKVWSSTIGIWQY